MIYTEAEVTKAWFKQHFLFLQQKASQNISISAVKELYSYW